jgi:hypothetical protein
MMLTQPKWMLSLAFALLSCSANASPLVYMVTGNQQFGTVDLATGAFAQIGPNTPEGDDGLLVGPNGSLLTLTSSHGTSRCRSSDPNFNRG